MPVCLPNECWLDLFDFLTLSVLGLRISLCSDHFRHLANARILSAESERCIEKIAVFDDHMGMLKKRGQIQLMLPRPVPECLPPWNVRIKSIIVYHCLGTCTEKFLRLLASAQPCVLKLDGSNFLRRFGARSWMPNVQKVVLTKSKEYGTNLFDIFNCQLMEQRLLETPILKCHMSEPDYNNHLLKWLHYRPANTGNRFYPRVLKLKGEQYNIEEFLRTVRAHFSCAFQTATYQVYISNFHGNLALMEWVDRNRQTDEQLFLRAITVEMKGNVKQGRGQKKHFYLLERRSGEGMNHPWQQHYHRNNNGTHWNDQDQNSMNNVPGKGMKNTHDRLEMAAKEFRKSGMGKAIMNGDDLLVITYI